MGDDTEFTKLPLEERCTHKLWKARLHGYTEAAKLFEDEEDEKAAIFSQFVGHIGKFVGDSNAAAQEKGLEAALPFVEHAALAGKTAKDVTSVIVAKCIAAPRSKTKELAVQLLLMYIEIEKHEVVVEELLKGMEHKNPKTVAACIAALTTGLREFGSRVVGIKPIIKTIGPLLEDRDKTVRDETKAMVVEIFRWIGDAIKPQLTSLKPVQLGELEVEFDKVRGAKATPTRYIKSQKALQQKAEKEKEEGAGADGGEQDEEDGGQNEDIDPYELMDPLNVLAKMPSDFQEKLEAKKWQERKEALEALDKILDYPKFEKGDYGDLVRSLMKVITKDANVVVVGFAVKCMARLAQGLKRGFQPYASHTLPPLLEKFKEKKANVVTPLREAVDAIFPNTTLEAIQEDLVSLLDNKNPSVKAETASFLARSFAKCTPANLNKKLLKVLVASLLKTLNESDPSVREASAEALGTAMKVVGEKGICPLMPDLDNLKMTKIKECCEKAVVVKAPGAKLKAAAPAKTEKARPDSAPAKPTAKAAAPKKVLSGGAVKKAAPVLSKPAKQTERERELGDDEVNQKAEEMLPEDVMKGLGDTAWKVRLESVEALLEAVKGLESKTGVAQVLVRVLARKPGFKETNFQVLKGKLDALKLITESFPTPANVVELVASDVTDKLGDPKNGTLAAETLTSLADATDLDLVATQVLDFALTQKNPKIQQESLLWVSEAIKEFGLVVSLRFLVECAKKGLNATVATVRSAAITLCGTLYLYQGQQVAMMIDDKPSVMALLSAEFEKHAGEKPPQPTRGSALCDSSTSDELGTEPEPEERVEEKPAESATNVKIDISTKITDALIAELGDKNWKTRNEALLSLTTIINDAKAIKANLGELPTVLSQRLVDSNGKLAVLALDICKAIAVAMGPPCKTHVKTFFRGFLATLGDSKQWVRSAALSCINTWGVTAGYKEFFEGEVIPDALKAGSPTLRTELWTLLSEILPTTKNIPKDEISLCVPHLYTSLEDRNSDVRKGAQAAVLGVMIHVGYANMVKQAEKLKPGSKTGILGLLEKTRPDLPVHSEPKSKAKKPEEKEKPTKPDIKPVMAKAKTPAVKPHSKKKEEDIDTTPLLPFNNLKNQRSIDEQKMKTLRWNFTLPRAEFVELLQEQMTTAGFNKTLIANMFHADFKFHLKAIESLSDDLDNVDALIANLDLILKWMTLRFFDTNPSVLLKGLEYLQHVFALLIENDYTVFDMEANSFIPYLVLKIGDPKDAVRDRVKAILKQLSKLYNPGKLFLLTMDGLKSKNARQRTECLEELGNLIEEFGMSVCQPNASTALKEIAKQISDRDNSVRSAALNAIVEAWFLEGEKIFKMIGKISEKNQSLLEERVKRATKNRPKVTPVKPERPEPKVQRQAEARANTTYSSKVEVEEEEEPEPEPEPVPVKVKEPYLPVRTKGDEMLKDLIEIDDSFIESPVKIPEYILLRQNRGATASTRDDTAEQMLREMGSPNLTVAFQAASKLRVVLESQDSHLLHGFTDVIMDSLVVQLKLINSYSLEQHGLILPQTFRMLFRIIDDVFTKETTMGKKAKAKHLQLLIHELLLTLVEEKTAKFAEGGYNKWINVFVARIIEEANHTNVTCAIIQLLFGLVANPPTNPKMTDMSTKCLLKIIVLFKQPGTWKAELDLDEVLYECHLFFQAYPLHTWNDRPSNMPLKAIKTLLLHLVTYRGKEIFSHLTKIENPCSSELSLYLKKLIKMQPGSSHGPSSTRLSKHLSEHLSDIFMKIAYEETAKEGLLQLYEVKRENPHLDLSSFLAATSKYFQDYVEKGLRDIERERGNTAPKQPRLEGSAPGSYAPGTYAPLVPLAVIPPLPTTASDEVSEKDLPSYYFAKLQHYTARVGYEVEVPTWLETPYKE